LVTEIREPPLEAFDIGVLYRLAGIDEIELYAMIISPAIKSTASELRAIINGQNIRTAAQLVADVGLIPKVWLFLLWPVGGMWYPSTLKRVPFFQVTTSIRLFGVV